MCVWIHFQSSKRPFPSPKTKMSCLVNYCHRTRCPKVIFSNTEDSCVFKLDPGATIVKTQIWFVMFQLIILRIILKLPCFYFEIPIFPRSLPRKKCHVAGEEFLYTLCSLLVNYKKPKEESHRAGSSGSSFFSFPPNFNQPTTK